MKLILIFVISVSLVIFSGCNKSNKSNKSNNTSEMEIWAIDELKSELLAKKIDLTELCENKNLDKKTKTMCEDIVKAEALRKKISEDTHYEFFLDCAKSYSQTMISTIEKMKVSDPEGYKLLNFGDETALYKYIALPETTRVMAVCEYQAESKYWKGLIKNGMKEDMKFCIEVMTTCHEVGENQCPKDKDLYLKECRDKL